MTHAPTTLRELGREERRAAARTLAASFYDDPLFSWIVPSEARRLGWLEAFMRASLALCWPVAENWAATGDDLPAVISFVGPGRYPPSRLREIAFLFRLLPRFAIGQPRPGRASAALRALARTDAVHLAEPHWYLIELGVHPEHQKKGLGRAIVEQALTRADADGLPAYLETSNPVNLDFYGRFGFEVVDTIEIGETPPIWTMSRAPR